jgi:hypothetical protein
MAADEEILITLKVDTTESAKSLKQLRQEYKDQLKELEGLTVGTKEYIDALSKIGGIKDEIGDLNQTINAFNPEGKIQAFGNVVGGLASGIQGAVGAMALFGVESEETQKMLLKVQAASAFAEGIKGVIGLGDAFGNLKLVLGQTAIGQKLVTAGQWLWNAAMNANPIGLIIMGITALVGAFALLSSAQETAAEKQARLNELEKEQLAQREKDIELIKRKMQLLDESATYELNLAKAQGRSREDLYKIEHDNIQKRIDDINLLKWYRVKGELSASELLELNKLNREKSLLEIKYKTDTINIISDKQKKSAEEQKKIDDKIEQDKKINDAKILASTEKLIEDTKKLKEDEELRLAANDEIRLTILKERELVLLQEQYNASNKSLESQQAFIDAKLAIDQKYLDDVNTLRTTEAQKIAEEEAAALLKAQELKTAQLELKSTNANAEYEQLVAQGNLGLALSIDLAQQKADAELAVLKDKNERGLLSAQEYADAQAKIEEDLQAKKLNAVEGGLNSAQSLSNAFFSLAQASAGKDAKKQLELKKKQFKVDKAFNLVRATIDGIRSVQAALTQTPPLSYVLAAFNGVMAAANIAKIASSKFEGETGGGGGGSSDIPSAMTAPTINAPSSSSTQLNADGSVKPSGGQITSRVIVVESDITNKQRQVASMQQNASV